MITDVLDSRTFVEVEDIRIRSSKLLSDGDANGRQATYKWMSSLIWRFTVLENILDVHRRMDKNNWGSTVSREVLLEGLADG